MKKLLLTFAFLFIASQAYAVSIQVTQMDFYPPGSTTPNFTDTTIGANPPAPPDIGIISTGAGNSASGGFSSDVGPVYGDPADGFFGVNWTANAVWSSTTPGLQSWSGTSTQGAFNYGFTLAAGDVAFGLSFNWSINNDIPVLAVFTESSPGVWTPVDTDGDGAAGTAMQTPPFPTQTPAFSGVTAIPEPASMLLIGTGLAGLMGIARRKKD